MITSSSRSVPVLRRNQNLIFNRLSSSNHHQKSTSIIHPHSHLPPLDSSSPNNPPHQNSEPPSHPKPSTRRATKLLKKICRSRDPLNPLLDQFISGNNQPLSLSNPPQSGAQLGDNHPVSATLSEFESSKKIYSSSQAMNKSIQKLIKANTLSRTPSQPSTSKVALENHPPSLSHPDPSTSSNPRPTFRSVEQVLQWSQIYIRFLKSSPNQEVFARRIKELIHKRLPKRLIEPIIRFHSSEDELVSVESYNHLIAHYYQSERYHQARRLMKEMEDRGISKNQETQELIACSYQALNKFKGVQLTLDSIKAEGNQVSNQCLTKLFSIRPRRPSKLEHFDSMDDPVHSSGTEPPLIKPSIKKEDQRWMPIEDFLKHHHWNSENFSEDGRALVTLTKRLMELGRWKEAKEFVEMTLTLDLNRSRAENSCLAISPYWATSLLEALVFGLYTLKRQQSTRDSTKSTSHPSRAVPNKPGACTVHHQHRLPVDCIFEFVERFIDQHPAHHIKANTRILLNCFRFQTFLPPSQIHRISSVWISRYGLKPDQLGSRLGIRLLHVMSAWFLRLLRSTQSQISDLDQSNSSSSLVEEIRNNLNQLIKEYLIIDEHLIECLRLNRLESSAQSKEVSGNKRREDLLIERLILNGPVDGKLIKANYRFISLQDLQSIKSSLKKIFKIRTKIIKLLVLNFRAINSPSSARSHNTRPDEEEETDDDEKGGLASVDLINFYRPFLGEDGGRLTTFLDDDQGDCSRFYHTFQALIDRLKAQQNQPQNYNQQHTLELVDKLPTPTRSRPSSHLPSAYHALLCWRSEDKLSSPIYFKSSSSSSS